MRRGTHERVTQRVKRRGDHLANIPAAIESPASASGEPESRLRSTKVVVCAGR